MSGDYEALNERLQTLPDQLSYDIMVSALCSVFQNGTIISFCEELSLKRSSFLLLPRSATCLIQTGADRSSAEQVPFGPLAFMPGKLVHTNEVTALLGDNWFAKCSTKQAQKIVGHRLKCESAFCPLPEAIVSFYLPSLDEVLLPPAEGVAASSLDSLKVTLAEPLLTK